MTPPHLKSIQLTVSCFVFLALFSCSKDSDMLADYIIGKDPDPQSIAVLADDRFFIGRGQAGIVLDVLNNDVIPENADVAVVETSTPQNGEVVINEDNSLTYTPNPEATTDEEDSFTYTTEVITPDNSTSREEATVTITTSDMGELKAFPSAEGYGKYTTGGRGGIVYHVTNLNNDGQGSLRYGVESIKLPRTIVFDVSGYIKISEPLKIRKGYGNITIAGETAPTGGITIRGSAIWVHDGNVIIRYLKIRPGKDAYNPSSLSSSDANYEPDDGIRIQAYQGESFENIMIDHCTVTWAHDGLIDISAPNSSTYIRNVTIQNSLLAENVDKKYGVLVNNSYNVSFYRNIIAFTSDRNIAISPPEGQGVEMVNNFVYATDRAAWYREGSVNDFIGNAFVSGLRSRLYETFKMELTDKNADIKKSLIYINDNLDNGRKADLIINDRATPYIVTNTNHNTGLPITPGSEIESRLVDNVGDIIHYDAADRRIMSSIKSRTGNHINHESTVGGYPNLESTSRESNYDTDNDGMSDNWERQRFGDLSRTGNGDEDRNGYTNLEEFLYSLTL